MTDHQRADSIGMVQAGVEVTPNLNRLAGRGAVFLRAYTTCPLCVPDRTAIATGKYPTKTGVVFNDWRGLTAANDFDGVSLLEPIASGTPPPERPVFCQYSGNPTLGDIRRAVIAGRFKYIYDPTDIPELYDLESDPLEMKNLVLDPAYRRTVEEPHRTLKKRSEEKGDWVRF